MLNEMMRINSAFSERVTPVRIFLADDQAKVRSALRLLLDQESGFHIVGEAAETEDLLAQVKVTKPDLILLDWELPDHSVPYSPVGSGSRLLSTLHIYYPGLRVIALSGRLEARQAALAAGADAFVSKGDPPERLLATLRAIRETMNGSAS
jgi:DNA-binding NarL/FixJ family response regulator